MRLGCSRAGEMFEDLTEWPHGLVAGQTYGGKSNFLHYLLLQLAHHDNCKLFIIDLKRMEFEAYRRHAWVAYRLPEAVKILEYLYRAMQERMDILAAAGCVKIQEYDGDMPFHVLVVDEFSQVCPVLSKSPEDKKIRQYAHSLLVDLICLARALGIHIVIATQRPDAEILPGQFKANIPATVCFKVRNTINSRICLDNDRAAYLPAIKGRCVYQFRSEYEMQVPYVDRIRDYLPARPLTMPVLEPTSKLA